MRSFRERFNIVQSLGPAARDASADGASADLQGYHGATAVIDAGAWTDGSHTFVVEDSDDDVTFAPVADGLLDGAEPVVDGAPDDDQAYRIGYLGMKRYLRVAVTVAGATTGLVASASIVRTWPRKGPA